MALGQASGSRSWAEKPCVRILLGQLAEKESQMRMDPLKADARSGQN